MPRMVALRVYEADDYYPEEKKVLINEVLSMADIEGILQDASNIKMPPGQRVDIYINKTLFIRVWNGDSNGTLATLYQGKKLALTTIPAKIALGLIGEQGKFKEVFQFLRRQRANDIKRRLSGGRDSGQSANKSKGKNNKRS
tara:strand:- start:63 stop:488 length:426 start_codon:yes stop_codon:yes gene_type:complete